MALFLAFSLVLINLISPVPAFATTNAAHTVAEVPALTGTGTNLASDPGGFVLATRIGTNTIVQYAVGTAPTFPTEEGTQTLTALYRSGTSMKVLVWSNAPVSALNTGSVYAATLNNTSNQYNTTSIGSIYTGTSYNGGKYIESTVTSYDNWEYTLTPFESRSDALDAISSYVPAPTDTYAYILEPGHVIYIDAAGYYQLLLSTVMSPKSAVLFASDPWPESNQNYCIVSSLPTDQTVLPYNAATRIRWSKDPNGEYGFLGRTKNAYAELTLSVPANNYVSIYNPLYWNTYFYTDENYTTDKANGPIIITGLPACTVIDYDLSQRAGEKDGVVSIYGYITNSTDPYTGNTSELQPGETINSVNSEGAAPDYGGSTETPKGSAVEQALNKINTALDNFVDSITSLLSAPISHITRLISVGSEFMQSLSGLYTWLPPEVSSTIISALIVVVIIGVFKVLL